MKSLTKIVIVTLFWGLFVTACIYPKSQVIPELIASIPEKLDTTLVKIDTVVKNIDTIKTAVGEQIFEFNTITSPDILFSFPSHSIVMIPVTYIGIDKGVANSFCEYWLYTKDGKLVCYCKNTVSGLHPVYANTFNANNHLPEYTQKIGYGEYHLVYKNISKVPVRQDLTFGLIINQGKDQIDTTVDSGETKEFWINLYPSTSIFKLNNNNKSSI